MAASLRLCKDFPKVEHAQWEYTDPSCTTAPIFLQTQGP